MLHPFRIAGRSPLSAAVSFVVAVRHVVLGPADLGAPQTTSSNHTQEERPRPARISEKRGPHCSSTRIREAPPSIRPWRPRPRTSILWDHIRQARHPGHESSSGHMWTGSASTGDTQARARAPLRSRRAAAMVTPGVSVRNCFKVLFTLYSKSNLAARIQRLSAADIGRGHRTAAVLGLLNVCCTGTDTFPGF